MFGSFFRVLFKTIKNKIKLSVSIEDRCVVIDHGGRN